MTLLDFVSDVKYSQNLDDVAHDLLLETAERWHYPTSPLNDTVATHCDLALVYSLPAPRF